MNISSSILLLSLKSLILAAALGALIGLERKWAQKEAGLRTFSLISLGAALFVIISRLSFSQYLGVSSLDPSRTLGQVIVGVGFLCAGIIIFQGKEGIVKNVTTAAMMWVTSAVGAAVGLELYWIAIFTTILIMFINLVILPFEKRIEKKIQNIKDKDTTPP
jgi:putative Mg2+ transporter-C (MgtC) family protein